MSDNAKTSDDSLVMCEKGDCGEQDCEKCQASTTKPDAKSMEECMGRSMETLSKAFRESARRWEMIVYPSLFAFIVLAAYGFYLIYSLTQDAHQMAGNMQEISNNMQGISNNMLVVSERMVVVSDTIESQSASMREMVVSMHNMNVSMNQMRQDMSVMNYNVSRPMNKINSFMPW